MPDTYKLQYDGMTLAYPNWNGYVSYEAQSFKTLTLLNSEGGTLTANTLTGYPGDTINLSTAYNTYWRFSGYQITGDGSLVGNDYTFGTEDATICACFKPNAFTATGGWEKGSNVDCYAKGNYVSTTKYITEKFAIHGAHTGDVPANWYSTSNRWHPSNASAYKITLNPKMTVTANKNDGHTYSTGYNNNPGFTGVSRIGSTYTQSQSWTVKNTVATQTWNYNKSFTSDVQSTYSISGKLTAYGVLAAQLYYNSRATYIATATTGGWTATGYAP